MLPTFPSRYWFTIGLPEVFSLARWSSLFQTGFHVSRPTQVVSLSQPVACTGVSPSSPDISMPFQFPVEFLWKPLQPRPVLEPDGLGSVPFDRHYSGHRSFFLFLRVLRCFSSPRSPQITLVTRLQRAGLPHSDTSGSIRVCRSPDIFAAYRVLLRLRKPRHPPFALLSLSS